MTPPSPKLSLSSFLSSGSATSCVFVLPVRSALAAALAAASSLYCSLISILTPGLKALASGRLNWDLKHSFALMILASQRPESVLAQLTGATGEALALIRI